MIQCSYRELIRSKVSLPALTVSSLGQTDIPKYTCSHMFLSILTLKVLLPFYSLIVLYGFLTCAHAT